MKLAHLYKSNILSALPPLLSDLGGFKGLAVLHRRDPREAKVTQRLIQPLASIERLAVYGSDCFNLNKKSVMQRTAGNDCACWPVLSKDAYVNLIHGLPKIDVRHKERHL